MSFKYNLVNYVLPKLQGEWSWIGVVDYNVEFSAEIIEKTLPVLESNQIVQMYSSLQLMNNLGEILSNKPSLVSQYRDETVENLDFSQLPMSFGIGKAWAFRRDFLITNSGIPDIFLTGNEELFLFLMIKGQCFEKLEKILQSAKYRLLIQGLQKKLSQQKISVGFADFKLNEFQISGISNVHFEHNFNQINSLVDSVEKN